MLGLLVAFLKYSLVCRLARGVEADARGRPYSDRKAELRPREARGLLRQEPLGDAAQRHGVLAGGGLHHPVGGRRGPLQVDSAGTPFRVLTLKS